MDGLHTVYGQTVRFPWQVCILSMETLCGVYGWIAYFLGRSVRSMDGLHTRPPPRLKVYGWIAYLALADAKSMDRLHTFDSWRSTFRKSMDRLHTFRRCKKSVATVDDLAPSTMIFMCKTNSLMP